jgi:prephenate dehydrogenase
MTVEITIIGLGQTGSSFGLALAERKQYVHRTGHDKEASVAQAAQKIGAIDEVSYNLHRAVEGADIVLLTIPIDQIHSTLEVIAEDLKEGAVVMDTSPAKQVVAEWMRELLPEGRYYVGLTPAINPLYIQEAMTSEVSAKEDYFKSGVIAISAPQGTPSEAYKLAADLIKLVGAEPLFADMLEMDGLMTSAQLIPQLLSSVLIYTLVHQPGWREARKFAGSDFWSIGAPCQRVAAPAALAQTWMANRKNVHRLIDLFIAVLQDWQSDIDRGDAERIGEEIDLAQKRFRSWQSERKTAQWEREGLGIKEEIPSSGERMASLIGLGGRFRKKTK